MIFITTVIAMLSFVWVAIMTIALDRSAIWAEAVAASKRGLFVDADMDLLEDSSSSPMGEWDESFVDELFLP